MSTTKGRPWMFLIEFKAGQNKSMVFLWQKLTCIMRWTLAVVGVHTIHAHATILATVAWTVINVMLAVRTSEA